MDADTTIKSMLAVLNCKAIGNSASIFAALDIAKTFVEEFNPTQFGGKHLKFTRELVDDSVVAQPAPAADASPVTGITDASEVSGLRG